MNIGSGGSRDRDHDGNDDGVCGRPLSLAHVTVTMTTVAASTCR